MHGFTNSTPVDRGVDVVAVYVAAWEIECCASPPEVGREATWVLSFTADDTEPEIFHRPVRWDRIGSKLSAGGVSAYWRDAPDDLSDHPSGLRGRLQGTVHGADVPDGFDGTTGTVLGVYLLDELYREDEAGVWRPLPGTELRTSVGKSPSWFGGSGTFVSGMDCRKQTGVVMELAVPG
ncbi:DUF6578 domain-containing protein [Rhodococcus sp. UNC363MFTsu5.1]|uniref:DUF6578 domain-containing protein n=1 Tax=Rhodococcus sp. UNC363MFTsu5.1 TaxID=1449069 RepID=UPI00068F5DE4|nr:DUF6578 domain-containing protein [Rhodococcus sp. UNC363MFTsu5.1]